jgi:long-chain acyl-CoA synthetase
MLDAAERSAVASRPWLARYDPGVPATVDYPPLRLDELLDLSAHRHPDQTALIFFGRATSYRALDEAVDRIAGSLQRLGLSQGERIGLYMPNCPQLVKSFYAIWRAGCAVVPINPRASAPEVARYLSDSGAAAAIVLDHLWLGLKDVALPSTLRHLVVADVADELPFGLRIGARITRRGTRVARFAAGTPQVLRFKDLARESTEVTLSLAGSEDPAVLLYTGGTTGLPKAAMLTHGNLVANTCQIDAWAPELKGGSKVVLSALPLAHGYAMTVCMNASVLRGWTQVLVPDPRDIKRLLDVIERSRVTVFPGVPTLYAAICAHPSVTSGRRDLSSIEVCISGAASLPSGLQAEFERVTGGRLVEGYGLSEASPATHCNPLARGGRSDGIGLPLPDTDCRLVDVESETHVVEAGEPGVLCVSGPQVMAGYWQRPNDTAQVLRRDGEGRVWLHTGDVAEMTPDGYFRIVDRKKDIIVAAGGLKVYPNEIEDVLSTHPKVRLAAIIGVPVGGANQRAKAFVVLRDGEQATPDEILAFLRSRLAPYKIPKTVEFRTELPLAFTGKVLRRALADEERTGGPVPTERDRAESEYRRAVKIPWA